MEHLPNATLANYPQIGHIPQEEVPERSATDLKAWMDTLPLSNKEY